MSRLLQRRFRAAGVLHDIDAAVAEAEEGVAALPEAHPVHHALLAELGNALNTRFRELHAVNDIDRAIAIFNALAARPLPPGLDPEDRLTPPVNQATAHLDRYFHSKASEDLTHAIDLLRRVVSDTAHDSPRRSLRVNNLGAALYLAFRDRGDRTALRDAITLQREAAKTKNIVLQVHALAALARSLDAAAHVGDADAHESTSLFREACRLGLRENIDAAMWAAMTWGRAAWGRGDWDAAAEAYGYAGDGARLLFARQTASAERHQEIRLSQFREVGARAAFALARAKRVEDAAVVLELSRAQLLMQAIEHGRTLERAPDLDVEMRPATPSRTVPATHGLDIGDIAAAAEDIPLVYMASTDRGGLALLVRDRKVDYVELPRLQVETVAEKVLTFLAGLASPRDRVAVVDATTRWLWDVAMGPVLERLQGCDAAVLVPGGLLTLLPLHAAWTPDDQRPAGRRYALDLAVLSYAPSARSFGVARARAKASVANETSGQALVVADPESRSAPPLEFANDEAELVKWHVPKADRLTGKMASVARVSEAFANARLTHFAGHGFADLARPLESGLMLAGDETLSVRTIRDLHVNARLAVLSACRYCRGGYGFARRSRRDADRASAGGRRRHRCVAVAGSGPRDHDLDGAILPTAVSRASEPRGGPSRRAAMDARHDERRKSASRAGGKWGLAAEQSGRTAPRVAGRANGACSHRTVVVGRVRSRRRVNDAGVVRQIAGLKADRGPKGPRYMFDAMFAASPKRVLCAIARRRPIAGLKARATASADGIPLPRHPLPAPAVWPSRRWLPPPPLATGLQAPASDASALPSAATSSSSCRL